MKPTRRQLLKGSLAAPLVLTARPASAWALSSAAACKVRDADKSQKFPGPEKLAHHTADEWLRVDCDLHKIRIYDGKKRRWVSVKDNNGHDKKFFLGADKTSYWEVSESLGQLSAKKSEYTVSNCKGTKTGERKYGLCYVDDDMYVVGHAWETHGGKCISKSCWTSINAAHR